VTDVKVGGEPGSVGLNDSAGLDVLTDRRQVADDSGVRCHPYRESLDIPELTVHRLNGTRDVPVLVRMDRRGGGDDWRVRAFGGGKDGLGSYY